MLAPAFTVSFAEDSSARLCSSPPWANNNLNSAIQTRLPVYPDLLTSHDPASQTELLPKLQSLQIRPPNILSGIPLKEHVDPGRIPSIPSNNSAPFNASTEGIMSPTLHSNVIGDRTLGASVNVTNSRNPTTAYRGMRHQMMSESNRGITPEELSQQQVKANANLELANQLSANKNIVLDDDTPLITRPPLKGNNLSLSVSEFPPLK